MEKNLSEILFRKSTVNLHPAEDQLIDGLQRDYMEIQREEKRKNEFLLEQVKRIHNEVLKGNLDFRSDVGNLLGYRREIIQYINEIMDALVYRQKIEEWIGRI